MNKLIVGVFDTDESAANALAGVQNLHVDGDVTLYATAVFSKDPDGRIKVKQLDDQGPVGTAWGVLIGGLVGALAGPAGMAIGAAFGGLGGSLSDLYEEGVDARFVDEVAKVLEPGKVALVLDIDEEWTAPVNAVLQGAGGVVFRTNRTHIEDAQWESDVAADQAELDALETELKTAAADQKARIQTHIDEVKQRIADKKAAAKARLEKAKANTEAKVKHAEAQVKTAKEGFKAKIEARIEKIKADFEARKAKLHHDKS